MMNTRKKQNIIQTNSEVNPKQELINCNSIQSNNISEAKIHSQLVNLLSYSNFHFKQEDPISNSLISKDGCTSRRLDLTIFKQGVANIYEIKKDMITTNHITTTLGDKGYYQLAKKRYNQLNINFTFISPLGISEEALRLLDCMDNVDFTSVSNFVSLVLQTIKLDYDINCKEGLWYFENHIANQFKHLIEK